MQEEEEGVLVEYLTGIGRGCPGEKPCRKRERVSWWNTMQEEGEGVLAEYHEGRGKGCPAGIPCRKRERVEYHA
jgi:hypothetical protein